MFKGVGWLGGVGSVVVVSNLVDGGFGLLMMVLKEDDGSKKLQRGLHGG